MSLAGEAWWVPITAGSTSKGVTPSAGGFQLLSGKTSTGASRLLPGVFNYSPGRIPLAHGGMLWWPTSLGA